MTTTTARPSPTVSGPIADRGRRRVRLLAFLLLGLALLTVAGVIAWNSLQSPPQPAGTTSFDPGSTYAPGGSVYDEQVPKAARSDAAFGPGSTYAPGGSVYDEQVPQAAS